MASTNASMTGLSGSTSGCHSTPRTHGRLGSSIASGRSSKANDSDLVIVSPSPRPTHRLAVVGLGDVHSSPAASAREPPAPHRARSRRNCRGSGDVRRGRRGPADVHECRRAQHSELHPATDSERRLWRALIGLCDRQSARSRAGSYRRSVSAFVAVGRGYDVAPSGEHQPIDRSRIAAGSAGVLRVRRHHHNQRAGALHGPDVDDGGSARHPRPGSARSSAARLRSSVPPHSLTKAYSRPPTSAVERAARPAGSCRSSSSAARRELDDPRVLVGRGLGLDVILQLARELRAGRVSLAQDDDRAHHGAALLVGRRDNRGLRDRRVRDERRLHLERPDPVAGGDDQSSARPSKYR